MQDTSCPDFRYMMEGGRYFATDLNLVAGGETVFVTDDPIKKSSSTSVMNLLFSPGKLLTLQTCREFTIPKVMRSFCSALSLLAFTASAEKTDFFLYDKADEIVETVLLENPLYYDAGIATASNGLWIAWLEFQPKSGDQIWLGLRGANGKWIERKQISSVVGDYANPTPTIDALGRLWVSYETSKGSNWNVEVQQATEINGNHSEKNSTSFVGINHRITAGPDGSVVVVCQQESQGRFRAIGMRISNRSKVFTTDALKDISTSGNAWHPSVAVSADNSVHLICDAYDGQSYNVLSQFTTKATHENLTLAATPGFEANAQIASGKDGKVWVVWEEDGENWGKRYVARTPGDKKSTKMVDNEGPLHRFRKLHFGELDEKSAQLKTYDLPQPSFELSNHRTNAPPDLKNFGAFYEGAQLVVDGQNRPWIVYRHFYVPWIGIVPETHKQDNARLYARCLLRDGWSKLYSFTEGQGDGMQRISVSPKQDGINLAWTTGRTDRRDPKSTHRGIALAEISFKGAKAKIPAKTRIVSLASNTIAASPALSARPVASLGSRQYELFYGDLHRHTDISLCFSPADGTIDDAYRYAIDAAPLDFMGITDHTHDLAMGDPLSLVWWRSRKEVDRHALGTKFFPFYSYERSRGDTDHNVFSLRDDMLRPHTYPLTQFWSELDTNTFTIAHQPFNRVLWNYKDNIHRPLVEIYQGFRNNSVEQDAKEGLMRGHQFGIIAASDHLSTGASYAGVWAEKPSRESIFRAMQARRTFGSTSKITLKVTCGEHWMGESFATNSMPPIQISVQAPSPISDLELFLDGELLKTGVTSGKDGSYIYDADKSLTGAHLFYVHVKLLDGNRAWSSPLWVTIKPL